MRPFWASLEPDMRPSPGGSPKRRRRSEPRGQKGAVPDIGPLWWVQGNARYTQAYGNANPRYEHGYHDGVDIGVAENTNLAAITSGTVVFAGNAGADGWRVGIRMANGKTYYYGHLNSVLVKVGDEVKRGQVVAKSGNTGRSSGPHVHFELDRDRNGVGDSPLKFLQRWAGKPAGVFHGPLSPGGKGPTNGGKKGGGKGTGSSTGAAVPGFPGPGGMDGLSGEGLGNGASPDYGWSEAVFNANPELRKILRQAQANDWDAAAVQAAIRGTKWYRDHSTSWRQMWVLKHDNPKEYSRLVEKKRLEIDAFANEWGISLDEAARNKIARESLWLGLSPDEINDTLATMFDPAAGAAFGGQAGEIQDAVMSLAGDYGVRVSEDYVEGLVRGIISGDSTVEDADNYIKELAKSTYAALAPQIDQGMTVRQIANPYLQSMAAILEVNGSNLDLYDPTIRSALTARDQAGAPTVKPIWKFEEDLRKDPRWFQTNNARDQLLGLGNQVLKMWGVI